MGLFGLGAGRICAVAAAETAAAMAAQVRAALRETSTVELRFDWLKSDAEKARLLAWLAKRTSRSRNRNRGVRGERPNAPVFLATCRRQAGGGRFRGDVEAEMKWLLRAHQAGCLWCDLEVESSREAPPGSVRGRLGGSRVLLSLHDFRRTPPMNGAQRLLRQRDVDAVKIAVQSRSIADSLRVLRAARGRANYVAVPMGEIGLPGRILALREGSALAYAPVATATAPGQISLWELKHLYRAHELNRQTRVYGVIGNPVGHSLSPVLHNTGFVAGKMNAVYVPFLVKDLPEFLKAAPEFGVNGFSVTLPYKQSIMRHLDDCDALAAEIGAVNTVVVRRDGSLYGCNTDYAGVLRSLEKKLRIARSRVLILGAGGAARAAAFALARAGATVVICARRQKAARSLARLVGGEAVPRRTLQRERFDAIVNATPVGMYPRDEISPLAGRELHCRIAMDLIYRPERTKLLKIAGSKGITTVSGAEMFLAQGIAQWEMWSGRRAPEAQMRRAVLAALRAEANPRGPR